MTAKNKLCRAYSKRLKQMNKTFFTKPDTGLNVFVEYLRYLRDLRVVTVPHDIYSDEQAKLCVATLVAAIAEFDAWKANQEPDKKTFHWNNFMELTKQNFTEWITLNDSV